MADAVEDGLLATNPVPQLTRHRRRAPMRSNSDPLTVHEVKQFLDAVPEWYRDLYDVCSDSAGDRRSGWGGGRGCTGGAHKHLALAADLVKRDAHYTRRGVRASLRSDPRHRGLLDHRRPR